MTALRHRLYRYLHPRRFHRGELAEQRHQFLELDLHLVREDYTRPAPIGEPPAAGMGRVA
ncbi:hypothetical protein [Streptomyces sp. NPDC051162]|uniref:hypothetical protein n=1 Tax=Streptomyces sp. NPDC051162 TaxID=3154747 RepID=UPI003448AF1B